MAAMITIVAIIAPTMTFDVLLRTGDCPVAAGLFCCVTGNPD
jgi:hypothetical protein